MLQNISPINLPSWKKLSELSERGKVNIKEDFKRNPSRASSFSFSIDDFFFDFSKNLINEEIFNLLIELANESKLSEGIVSQFGGDLINETENRAVLHTELRNKKEGSPFSKLAHSELDKIKKFATAVHSSNHLGCTGKKITDIVNIGIGGSDLGPKMATHALRPYWKSITPHFISNVDGENILRTLEKLNPETTLFIIASKSFTTQETMTNAETAKSWFLKSGKTNEDIDKHFIAVSTNIEAAISFGINKENIFQFWDWVGGRYSVWSSIGISIALTVGFDIFEKFLKGAHEMDTHFKNTQFSKNIPVISALIGIWNNNFLGFDSLAVLPYDHRLRFLPNHLQQVDMESNGKSVDRNGKSIPYQTGPIIWGDAGTNGQHAFYQLIHQGTKIIPCEFIACANPHHEELDHHEKLLANFFAQSEALLNGKSEEEAKQEVKKKQLNDKVTPFKVFEGNRPSTSILIKSLTPENLGILIAYYEHKIFVQGYIWNIFSYDQWGVELGKQLAKPILNQIKNKTENSQNDASTAQLIKHFHEMRK